MGPSLRVKTVKDVVPDLLSAVRLLETRVVAVGWPADKNRPRQGGDPLTNAQIAFMLDKGSPARNQPPREVVEPGIAEGREAITAQLKGAGAAALNGDKTGVEKGLVATGLAGATAIRNKIDSGPFEKLADRTLADRRRRGRTGTRPWQDTGQIRNAVNSTVRGRS